MTLPETTSIKPQPGPQELFASCTADVAICGGSAFSGKSFSLLLEPLRCVGDPRFNGVIFRREMPQITAGGGLWDTSTQLYQKCGGTSTPSRHLWTWGDDGAKIKMTHLQREADKHSHQSAQYVYIAFDEVQQFTEGQFWYLWTRNRPPDGYEGRCWMRAGCNPDADSWLRTLIDWWIGEDGYPIKERSGVLRWFTRYGDQIKWVSEDWRSPDGLPPKSFTIIAAAFRIFLALLR